MNWNIANRSVYEHGYFATQQSARNYLLVFAWEERDESARSPLPSLAFWIQDSDFCIPAYVTSIAHSVVTDWPGASQRAVPCSIARSIPSAAGVDVVQGSSEAT